jgi:hypothetical protein
LGLTPIDFELQENDNAFDVLIKHKYTASWFDTRFERGLGKGSTWSEMLSSGQPPQALLGAARFTSIRRWLSEVKTDLETPDKWAELQRKTQLLSEASERITENSPFTPGEQTQIADQLRAMVERVERTYSLSPSEVKSWNDRLEYVVEASGRLGRKDWFLLFAGAIFTYLPVLLPPEAIRDMSLSLLTATFTDFRICPCCRDAASRTVKAGARRPGLRDEMRAKGFSVSHEGVAGVLRGRRAA